MMRWLLPLIFLLFWMPGYAQESTPYRPLAAYDFSTADFSLIFLPYYSAKPDSVYYLEDSLSLNLLREKWVFEEEAIQYPFACNDGYTVVLLRDKEVIDGFSIYNRCRAFVHKDSWWHLPVFSPVVVRGAETLVATDSMYNDLQQARQVLKAIRQDEKVMFIQPPEWEFFEGFFHFSVPNPNHEGKAPFTSWEALEGQVRQKLLEAYPESSFDLKLGSYGYGEHYPTVSFKVTSQQAFFNQFDLYPVSTWGWRPLPMRLTYYRRR